LGTTALRALASSQASLLLADGVNRLQAQRSARWRTLIRSPAKGGSRPRRAWSPRCDLIPEMVEIAARASIGCAVSIAAYLASRRAARCETPIARSECDDVVQMRAAAESDAILSHFGNEASGSHGFAGDDLMGSGELNVGVDAVNRFTAGLHSRSAIGMFHERDAAIAYQLAGRRRACAALTRSRIRAGLDSAHRPRITDDAIRDDWNRGSRRNADVDGRMIVRLASCRVRCWVEVLRQSDARERVTLRASHLHSLPSDRPEYSINDQPFSALKKGHGLGECVRSQRRSGSTATQNIHFNLVAEPAPAELGVEARIGRAGAGNLSSSQYQWHWDACAARAFAKAPSQAASDCRRRNNITAARRIASAAQRQAGKVTRGFRVKVHG